jgi:predicted nucleic acid-binding Zn ribbon protein
MKSENINEIIENERKERKKKLEIIIMALEI